MRRQKKKSVVFFFVFNFLIDTHYMHDHITIIVNYKQYAAYK
jgi:hypothetical protein